MNSSFLAHGQGHLKGSNATHPIEPRWRTPAALLLLAGRSPQRNQPCRPQSSQRLAFFALSRRARAHLEPQRSPCRPQSSQRLAFFALSKCARAHLEPQRLALQAAVKPEACLLRAVQVCAGTLGAAALSPVSASHRSPIGRVQLRFPG